MGALILHWMFAVVWIIATPNTSDGYGFVVGILFTVKCLWERVWASPSFSFGERTKDVGHVRLLEQLEKRYGSQVFGKADGIGTLSGFCSSA